MKKLWEVIKREVINIIPAVAFCLISFNLIVFTEDLMLRHESTLDFSYVLATVAALIAGKFLLIVNTFPFINMFPNKPLIYNIVWKFFLYGSFAIIFRIIDKMIDLSFKYEHIELISSHLQIILVSPIFWAIQVWLSMLLLVYVVASEFINLLGKEQIKSLLFESKPSYLIVKDG